MVTFTKSRCSRRGGNAGHHKPRSSGPVTAPGGFNPLRLSKEVVANSSLRGDGSVVRLMQPAIALC